MDKAFTISVLAPGKKPAYLGTMPENAISFNRYNEGLLVAAGKMTGTDPDQSMYMKFAAQFDKTVSIKFQNCNKTYYGEFRFVNFDADTCTVVFGSIGPIREVDTVDDLSKDDNQSEDDQSEDDERDFSTLAYIRTGIKYRSRFAKPLEPLEPLEPPQPPQPPK